MDRILADRTLPNPTTQHLLSQNNEIKLVLIFPSRPQGYLTETCEFSQESLQRQAKWTGLVSPYSLPIHVSLFRRSKDHRNTSLVIRSEKMRGYYNGERIRTNGEVS
jgi:hypothetical protein